MPSHGPLALLSLALLAGVAALLFVSVLQVDNLEERLVEQSLQLRALGEATDRLTGQVERLGAAGPAPAGAPRDAWPVDPEARIRHPEVRNLLAPPELRWPVPGSRSGGALVRGWPYGDPSTLNPVLNNAAEVQERLLRYVGSAPARRQLWSDLERFTGDLAWRVEVTEDFKVFTLYLRRGVRWHRPSGVDLSDPRYAWLDREHPFTAHDLAFTLALIVDPQVENGYLKGYYEDLEGWRVLDDHTLEIRWKRSLYGNLEYSVGAALTPVPEFLFAYDEDGARLPEETLGLRFNQHWYNNRGLVGTGPYRLAAYEPGVQLRLLRNEDYYGDKPAIREIVYPIYTDPNKTLLMLKAGELDFGQLRPGQYREEILRWQDQPKERWPANSPFLNGEIRCERQLGFSFYYLGWNGDRPLFADRRVRTAMTLAFNRRGIIENVFSGLGQVAIGPNHPSTPYNDTQVDPLEFDPARAAALLAEAGWSDSDGDGLLDRDLDPDDGDPARTPFAFTLLIYGSSPEYASLANIFKEDLLHIGVRMGIESAEWSLLQKRMDEKDFDAYAGGWGLGYPPDPYQLWHSSQADVPKGSNRVGFRRKDADGLIEQLRETFDAEERARLLRAVHRILYEEQAYSFFRVPERVSCWRRRVRGVVFTKFRPQAWTLPWWVEDGP